MSIIVENLSKTFKIKEKQKGIGGALKSLVAPKTKLIKAVEDISFTIDDGQAVGFIGPNGAGKSTTVKMLSGILYPSAGRINVNGLVPYKNRIEHVKNIGVVFGQKSQLWWDLPITDTFDLLKKIYKIPSDVYSRNLELFNEILGLHEFETQQVRQLSLGQRMRADIAAAFLHEPSIVFLDEPTIGLDVVAKEKIRLFIKEINRVKKTTLLFTTHDMTDIEKTCQRIIVIDKGKILYDGTIDSFKTKLNKDDFNEAVYEMFTGGI
ncbi:MAG: ATP-binding cassette domain-containing protein [Oscillospiraceae bacterium]|nr:ATP-binding cassette domain-containing protein [Oscillospiraceae bacterium]